MIKRQRELFLLLLLMTLSVAVCFVVSTLNGNTENGNMVRMSIILNDTTLDEIHRDSSTVKFEGNSLRLEDGKLDSFYEGVEIKGHGNSSWGADKKSYRIKFDKKIALLSMAKARKWVLIANDLDDSLLRNDTAFYLSRVLNDESPLEGEFVELDVDGRGLGLYYVTKSLSTKKEMLGLTEPDGILVEYDNVYGSGEEYRYETKHGGILTVKDVVADDSIQDALAQFGEDFDELEDAVERRSFVDVARIADVRSLAEYFLLSEFVGNPDAYLTSLYFYRDGASDKIHAGPGWDFDAAFGNRNWGNWYDDFYSPHTIMARREYAMGDWTLDEEGELEKMEENDDREKVHLGFTKIFYQLIEMPEFIDVVEEVYREKMLGESNEVLAYVEERANAIEEAALRNDKVWGKTEFESEVYYLKWWIEERFLVFDEIYGGKPRLPIEALES